MPSTVERHCGREPAATASFAGQQDTYLNITGKEAVLKHISKCLGVAFHGAGNYLPYSKWFRSWGRCSWRLLFRK